MVSDENGSNYAANFQPEGNRNDGNIICFGKKTFETIQNMKLFMVFFQTPSMCYFQSFF